MGSGCSRLAASDDAIQVHKRSKKNKENILAPFLRSMSCGASSFRRSNKFSQESRISSEDCSAAQTTSDKFLGCNGQPGPWQQRSRGEECHRKAFGGGGNYMVSQQGSECLSVPGHGESIFLSCGTGQSSSVAASASPSLLQQRNRNTHRDQGDTQPNRPSSDEHLLTADGCRLDALSDPLPRDGNECNPASSLGSSLEVQDTSGDVSELETSTNAVASQQGPEVDREALGVASSQQASQQANDLGVLHVEALGLVAQTLDESSSLLRGESSGREARRNNRRQLWDVLTRGTSHRRRFSPSLSPPNGSVNSSSTWNDALGLSDWNRSEESSGVDETFPVRRSLDTENRRWRSRPQVWALQQYSNAMEGSSGCSRHCAFGRHPNGQCSCEAFVMAEETSTRASISRIVMLAEALFEVLDEIHRQSVALSRSTSLSLISLPAPEIVVDSFAVRIHKRDEKADYLPGQCAECNICLVEYEDGDHIRVLPCCHEFHMLCVDKWLKEVHRICPLCRGNVCDETVKSSEASAASGNHT